MVPGEKRSATVTVSLDRMNPSARRAWSAGRPGRGHAVDAVCVAPWVSLEFDPSGLVYGCCANQTFPLGRIGEQRLAELWSGPRASVLRDALSRWDMSVGCGSCRWHLEHGRLDPDAAVYDRYTLDTSEPAGPASMTFALSNRCNLGCVMCTPELSSTLRRAAGLPAIESPYDDEFFDDLTAYLPGLQYAKFLGGEPFLIREHHRVWDLMAAVGGPPRIQVTTNGTVWNRRVESVLNDFAVDVTVSVDGVTAATYESIRAGANFAVVRTNIEQFRQRCAAVGAELRLCFCLMERNWHELPDFLRWVDHLGAAVSINVVSDIGMAFHDLPLAALEQAAAQWAAADATLHLTPATAEVWTTQLVQLDSVIAERRAGLPPSPRQAQRAPAGILSAGVAAVDGGAGSSVAETDRHRVEAWSGGGPVARVVGAPDGSITAVLTPLRRLGVDERLVGSRIERVVPAIEDAAGFPAWLLDIDAVDGHLVRTIVLSAEQPVRGAVGSIVRLELYVGGDGGWELLVGEDRFYDRGVDAAVPVEVVPRRS